MRRFLLPLALAWASVVLARDAAGPRLYRVAIETGLPHLEENLRYATTHETVCLGDQQLADAFPILRHVAFAGCALGDAQRDDGGVTLRLHCPAGSETTGSARWVIDAAHVSGTFEARLGGKNMTLYQRVTGRAVGACGAGR